MALLELKDIGKIYVSNNNVAVGIRGVNLSFNSGEFVAITGKSGSGKSTLLNVISGMDTYEEGELFIEGNPTSHYIQSDWEEYRQKYISFIFQDYNIIDNFTVLQNVELALMGNYDPIERKRRALELINRVGLSKAIHQKGSKLSGGQKQRTVIARALAKDSPIILADEPTGNLDSETSKEIIDLLYEVSKNKLVIIVTHNFEQVEDYATRHIRVYDGAIESDQALSTREDYSEEEYKKAQDLNKGEFVNGLSLGRIMFLSKPKLTIFLCLLMLIGILYCFYSICNNRSALNLFKSDYMFNDVDGRVIVVKENGTVITDNELENIKNETGASDIVHYDSVFDQQFNIFGVSTVPTINERFGYNIKGSYPASEDEVFLYLPIYVKEDLQYYIGYDSDNLIGKQIEISGVVYTISGYKYFYDNTKQAKISFTKEGFNDLAYGSALKNILGDLYLTSNTIDINLSGPVYYTSALKNDTVAIYGDPYKDFITNYYNVKTSVQVSDLYDTHTTSKSEQKKAIKVINNADVDNSVSRIDDYYGNAVVIYLSYEVMKELGNQVLSESYRQASLIYSNNSRAKTAAEKISSADYIAVIAKTTVSNDSYDVILSTIMNVFSLIGLLIALIFLSFFINICTSKSILTLKPDMSIMRSMGIKVKTIKVAIYFRMILALIPGFFALAIIAFFVYRTPALNGMVPFLHFGGYLVIVLGSIFIALRVANRHIKKLFSQSVKTSLVGGGEQ